MDLEWTMLANHAEVRDGLLYISGGTWDTVNVSGPLVGGPPDLDLAGLFNGFLVARLVFHNTEVPSDHTFSLVVMDEDGAELGKAVGPFRVEKVPGTPLEWGHGFNLIAQLTGLPLPKFGQYSIELLVDERHLGTRPFRVLKMF